MCDILTTRTAHTIKKIATNTHDSYYEKNSVHQSTTKGTHKTAHKKTEDGKALYIEPFRFSLPCLDSVFPLFSL